jgi:hypothetical protein
MTADYFERNAGRMCYPKFRRQHLFVGSGVIEFGCKTVIGSRLKQSGVFWTVRGANAIIALRCCRRVGPGSCTPSLSQIPCLSLSTHTARATP